MNISLLVKNLIFWFITLTVGISLADKINMPKDFVYLTDIDPTIIENVRYSTNENFMGRQVPGYASDRVICTKVAAEKLKLVNEDLKKQGYKIVVYDGYRRQRSVDAFMKWSKDAKDQVAKEYYYPTIDKRDVFKLGYISEKSGHSRGSTFDLTIIKSDQDLKPIVYSKRKLKAGEEITFLDDNTVDMGASFDLFHEASHHDNKLIAAEYSERRNFLRSVMKKHGFKEYKEEWWHYTVRDEPYPDTYFNF